MKNLILMAVVALLTISCTKQTTDMKPYVIEVTTFQYEAEVDAAAFWKRDAAIETDYTSLQPGYISRESGYSAEGNEVVVVVRWKSQADAQASMEKFMSDASVADYAAMIDANTMKMMRYEVK